MFLILRWILNALVLMFIPYLISGVEVANFYTALITALVLGLVNAVIRPVLIILTLPINILTLGLFTLVINGLLFWFVSSFIKGFSIAGFWPAFWAALIYSLVSIVFNYFLDKKETK
jgi:putative membrane protein